MKDIIEASSMNNVLENVLSAYGLLESDGVQINESRTGTFSPTPESVLSNLINNGKGLEITWIPEFLHSTKYYIQIAPEERPQAVQLFYQRRLEKLKGIQYTPVRVGIPSDEMMETFLWIKSEVPQNKIYNIDISGLFPNEDALQFTVPEFENKNVEYYFNQAYEAYMASYLWPDQTFNLSYTSSSYSNDVYAIKTGYNKNIKLIVNVSNLLPDGSVLRFEIPPYKASYYDNYLQDAYNNFMASYVWPDKIFNLSYTSSAYSANVQTIINDYNRNGKLIINILNLLPNNDKLSFEIPPFESPNYEAYFSQAYNRWLELHPPVNQPVVIPESTYNPDSTETTTTTVPTETTTTTVPDIIETVDTVPETLFQEQPIVNEPFTDLTTGGGSFGSLLGGGGIIDSGDFKSGEKVSVGDGGFVQLPRGIKVTGYVYPYTFLLITGAGAFAGFMVAKRFNQSTLGMLILVAAGLMGGSAVGMKIKPPVKVPK